MRIGIDASRSTAIQRTGTENYTLYLVRALLELAPQHHYTLYFNQPPAADLFAFNERVIARVLPSRRLWTHFTLGAELRRDPPDVLFVPAHVIPLGYRGASVVTVHDVGYRHYPQAHPALQRAYLDWSTRHNVRSARMVVADSHATRRDLAHFYGTPADKVVVAYPAGSPIRRTDDPQALARVQAQYDTGSDYILYLGSLQPRKNLPGLIRAFALAAHALDLPAQLNLVLAGRQGWLPQDLAEIARNQGVYSRVKLPGYANETDLPALLSGARAFALPSFYEGFGLPVLEAMACGTPVICSDASSLPEVAGDATILVDPDDTVGWAEALANVVQDTVLAEQLRQRGYQRASQFTWHACAASVLAALECAAGR